MDRLAEFGIESTEVLDSSELDDFFATDDEVVSVEETKKTPPKKEEKKPLAKKEVKKEPEQEEESTEDEEDPLEEFLEADEEEEEQLETKVKPKVGETDDPKNDNEEDDTFNAIAQELLAIGVFTKDSDDEEIDIKDGESFANRFRHESQKLASGMIDNFLNKFGEDYVEMFDAVFQKGVAPKDYLSKYTTIESLEGLDMAEEASWEQVMKSYYTSEGRSSEYINNKINKLKDQGDLEEEATAAHEILLKKERESLKKVVEDKEKETQAKLAAKVHYNQSMQKIITEKLNTKEFDGIPLTPKVAQETLDYLTTEKYQLPSGELLTQMDKDLRELKKPENFATRVKLGLLLQLIQKDPTLSTIKKKAVSEESNQIFSSLKQKAIKTKQNTTKEEREGIRPLFG